MIWVTLLALTVFGICGFICHSTAKNRGANPVLWGTLGFVFGPLAIPFVFLLNQRHSSS